MNALAPTIGFGLPLAALLAVAGYGANRLLRVGERRGWVNHPRKWTSSGIGNALLELHVALEPQRARIETRLAVLDASDERVGDQRPDLHGNVIRIDFVRRQRQ